jgi:hypothetical protein
VVVWTIGHGTRSSDELVSVIRETFVCTLVDGRHFPGSRHNPQFNEPAIRAVLEESGIAYRHAVELGGRLAAERGEDAFGCLRVAAFRSYAASAATAGKRRSPRRWRSRRALPRVLGDPLVAARPGSCVSSMNASAAFDQPLAATRRRKNHRPDVTN